MLHTAHLGNQRVGTYARNLRMRHANSVYYCFCQQVRSVVVVSRCTLRTFGTSEWASMRSKLYAWKENLAAVQATIASGKGGVPAAGARGVQAIKA